MSNFARKSRRRQGEDRLGRARCPKCGRKLTTHTKHPTEPNVLMATCGRPGHAVKFEVESVKPHCRVCEAYFLNPRVQLGDACPNGCRATKKDTDVGPSKLAPKSWTKAPADARWEP